MPEAQVETEKPAGTVPTAVVNPPATDAANPAVETPTQGKPEQTPKEKVEFFAKRKEAEAKKLAEENDFLKKQLEEFERSRKSTAAQTEEDVSLLDDPKKWAHQTKEDIKKAVIAEIQGREQEKQLVSAAESAEKWLLSQSHVQEDPKFTQELVRTIQSKYQSVAGVDPMAAARLAYEDVCKAKGITLDPSDGTSTIGVKPSGSSGGGKRMFARGEGQKYILAVDPAKDRGEYLRRVKEVAEAEKEGRIR